MRERDGLDRQHRSLLLRARVRTRLPPLDVVVVRRAPRDHVPRDSLISGGHCSLKAGCRSDRAAGEIRRERVLKTLYSALKRRAGGGRN